MCVLVQWPYIPQDNIMVVFSSFGLGNNFQQRIED